jgi:hypothetical protein
VQLHRWAAAAATITAGVGFAAIVLASVLPGRQDLMMACGVTLVGVAVPLITLAVRRAEARLGEVAEESFRLGLSSRGPTLLESQEEPRHNDTTTGDGTLLWG